MNKLQFNGFYIIVVIPFQREYHIAEYGNIFSKYDFVVLYTDCKGYECFVFYFECIFHI